MRFSPFWMRSRPHSVAMSEADILYMWQMRRQRSSSSASRTSESSAASSSLVVTAAAAPLESGELFAGVVDIVESAIGLART